MKRRDTIKTLLVGGLGTGALLTGCKQDGTDVTPNVEEANIDTGNLYGRTPAEVEVDKALHAAPSAFTKEELGVIAILCDIILPASGTAGSATDAEVPAFIDFMVKDIPDNRLPLKGGLRWLEIESNKRFAKGFADITEAQRIEIVDDIAYPEEAKPEMKPGVAFFNRMRDLTLSGYYTSKMGIEDLGYQGNRPNTWDGVPDDVLKQHGLAYEPEWVAKCVDNDKRNDIAEWDEDGNLLT